MQIFMSNEAHEDIDSIFEYISHETLLNMRMKPQKTYILAYMSWKKLHI